MYGSWKSIGSSDFKTIDVWSIGLYIVVNLEARLGAISLNSVLIASQIVTIRVYWSSCLMICWVLRGSTSFSLRILKWSHAMVGIGHLVKYSDWLASKSTIRS